MIQMMHFDKRGYEHLISIINILSCLRVNDIIQHDRSFMKYYNMDSTLFGPSELTSISVSIDKRCFDCLMII